jgi:hypothetical protein
MTVKIIVISAHALVMLGKGGGYRSRLSAKNGRAPQ